MTSTTTDILEKQIRELPTSDGFKEMARLNGFTTLESILAVPLVILLEKPDFSYHVYNELANILKEHNLLHLLKHE